MLSTPKVMGLHLHYRLWIAEMNYDINVLRIFEDYLSELSTKRAEPEVKNGVEEFKTKFVASRQQIDDLRHEMHLLKMKLAEYSREGRSYDEDNYKQDDHDRLQERYRLFRKEFEALKTDFSRFESEWL